jgi:hypothetical protein
MQDKILNINRHIMAEQYKIEKEGLDKRLAEIDRAYAEEVRKAEWAALEKNQILKDQTDKAVEILNANADTPFIKRMFDMKAGDFAHIKNEMGDIMTHLLSYVEEDGKFTVFPMVQTG